MASRYRHQIAALASLFLCLAMGTGCQMSSGSTGAEPHAGEAAAPVEEQEPDVLIGTWKACGVLYKGSYVSFEENEKIASLYKIDVLTVSEEGTYGHLNHVFLKEGMWEATSPGVHDYSYVLHQQTVARFTLNEDDELEKEVSESEKTITAYIDDDQLVLSEGEGDEDEDILTVYEKQDTESGGEQPEIQSSPRDTEDSGSRTSAPTTPTTGTAGERNALAKAQDYLRVMPFSRQGLIDQLVYEGFSEAEAEYGADHAGANWTEQAELKAKQYLNTMAFSRQGLIDQLVYEGFSEQEAESGVSQCGADWYEQAAKKARQYLDTMSFSRSGLIEQLEYEGFTNAEATYGVEQAGL